MSVRNRNHITWYVVDNWNQDRHVLSTGSYCLLVLRNRHVNCPFYAMFLFPFTYHNIDTVNLGRIKRTGLYFGTSLSRFLPSEMIKQANMAKPLLSNKHLDLLKTDELLLRMDKETVDDGRIKLRYLYFSCIRFKSFSYEVESNNKLTRRSRCSQTRVFWRWMNLS